ncbi:conserved hypothetical protein [Syntrophobacter sp. SbD1]|nr:conserved hypothetical protein [Syntrophobacter sp. SbD1]
MKGDFSRVHFKPYDNFNGILPQQGKVLLDSDGIAQTLIENNWRETAARDWVGKLAGVPAAVSNSFKISSASLSGGVVTLTVDTGRLWADGLLVHLKGESGSSTVNRTATWLEPPIVATEGSASDVAAGVVDAVVLEVWQHAVNGFQMPDILIEPALGGPDTAERLRTSFAFRLARLTAGQGCGNLSYNEGGRGALTVSLLPPITTTGDCPVVGSGGYSGFEHQLYRVEIADTSAGPSRFKWSRTNGGLVGRGSFDPSSQSIAITANQSAISGANQTSFYLEIESYDSTLGYSRVIAGAQATLSGSTLQSNTLEFGAYPSSTGGVFFRLWDGLSPVSSFPVSSTPVELENGILLQFDPDGAGKYYPGDYWMFPVRAQPVSNPQTLIDAKKPEGIVYYRVPLALITWANAGTGVFSGTIQDCRSIVQPLSQVNNCCTCRVGDGVESFGEFTSIQTAIDSLPAAGGEVCILPGRYYENVLIQNRSDIVIHGCGWRTRVASTSLGPAGTGGTTSDAGAVNPVSAVFSIVGSEHIVLRSFAVEAADDEAGVLIDGTGTSLPTSQASGSVPGVVDVTVEEMVLTAATLPAILAEDVQLLRVERNRVAMKDTASSWPAIYTSGTEIRIEKNWVGIQSAEASSEWLPGSVANDLGGSADNPVPPPPTGVRQFVDLSGLELTQVTIAQHPGGIQIGGASTNVCILDNDIDGGSRNGITLGSLDLIDANGNGTGKWIGIIILTEGGDCCNGTLQISGTYPGTTGTTVVAGGILTDIHIHRNRIRNMGICGIGPVGSFDLSTTSEIITVVNLNIAGNTISRTLLRDLEAVTESAKTFVGYGAVCLPDVQNLVVSDNTIMDFGAQPGVDVCGIFVQHGEMIEISRNRVIETRDWSGAVTETSTSTGGLRGGIFILLGTPPVFPQLLSTFATSSAETSGGSSIPIYEPGLPAVRVEHNVVRVPLNYALAINGQGPFSIVNNHLGCGGLVSSTSGSKPAQTVLILNHGTAIENETSATRVTDMFRVSQGPYSAMTSAGFQNVSNGTVLFSNNICQLETTASGQTEAASVWIFTPDHLIFTNNQCWLDGPGLSAFADTWLIAGSLNVVGNRFQETRNTVVFSGITAGVVNITGQNISTYCLIALGSLNSDNNNLALVQGTNTKLCTEWWREVIVYLD